MYQGSCRVVGSPDTLVGYFLLSVYVSIATTVHIMVQIVEIILSKSILFTSLSCLIGRLFYLLSLDYVFIIIYTSIDFNRQIE